jgi:hypothetical protein
MAGPVVAVLDLRFCVPVDEVLLTIAFNGRFRFSCDDNA